MYPQEIAEQLREHGHDVIAVVERPDLRNLPDREVFAAAQHGARSVVSENIRDFVPLANEYAGRADAHHGLVLVDPSEYRRGDRRTVGRMVRALAQVLADHPKNDATSLVVFL
jgi:hypothetical protein